MKCSACKVPKPIAGEGGWLQPHELRPYVTESARPQPESGAANEEVQPGLVHHNIILSYTLAVNAKDKYILAPIKGRTAEWRELRIYSNEAHYSQDATRKRDIRSACAVTCGRKACTISVGHTHTHTHTHTHAQLFLIRFVIDDLSSGTGRASDGVARGSRRAELNVLIKPSRMGGADTERTIRTTDPVLSGDGRDRKTAPRSRSSVPPEPCVRANKCHTTRQQ
jgi:hypothetical protein